MNIDDELAMLQRELMEAQEERTNPLSERTVAEIMVGLHRQDGNQYVTPSQLDSEIISLTKERGKIALNILPQILNLGAQTIEGRLNSALKIGGLTRQATNLYAPRYFTDMLINLRQRLVSEGKLTVQDIAIQHELNPEFLHKLLSENMDQLQAELAKGQLITRQYTQLRKAKILGFMLAMNNPVTLLAVQKEIGVEGQECDSTLRSLLEEKKLRGTLLGGYFVPEQFTANQHRLITQFFTNNGYIQSEMLKKKYLVSDPQEWVRKNLPTSVVSLSDAFFEPKHLESLAFQFNSSLKSEGFVDVGTVLPFEIDEEDLQKFLEQWCGMKDYFLCQGYCYSNQWLQRIADEFKQKVLIDIFFRKPQAKKEGKKKGKKEKVEPMISEEELKEVLFNCGFTDYTGAETLAPELLPLLLHKVDQLRKQAEKDLVQSKGFLNSTFLKYRSCKTILRSAESLQRALNVIGKQQQKGQKWVDSEFGPTPEDPTGQFSLVYYDKALPKNWPALDSLQWKEFIPQEFLKSEEIPLNKARVSQAGRLLELISVHNRRGKQQIRTPQRTPLTEVSDSPYVFEFCLGQKDRRWVLVDGRMPLVDGGVMGTMGKWALAEKAYAKLRYCYKAILGVGIQQALYELTGQQPIRYTIENQKQQQAILNNLEGHLMLGECVIVLGEGEADKPLLIDEKETEFMGVRPYLICLEGGKLCSWPKVSHELTAKDILAIFRNVFVMS